MNDRIAVQELPQVEVASVIHTGDFKDFMQAYQAVLTWITTNGYQVVGPFREVYHKFKPMDVLVEVQFPAAK